MNIFIQHENHYISVDKVGSYNDWRNLEDWLRIRTAGISSRYVFFIY